MSFDLVLRGGTLYDGSGMLGTRGDLAIDNGWIAAVGDVSGSAKREIDVSGLAVAPGFIDIKTHS
jgi:N-acyl-D-amino-acid deacylase